jgi:hypothetical protein
MLTWAAQARARASFHASIALNLETLDSSSTITPCHLIGNVSIDKRRGVSPHNTVVTKDIELFQNDRSQVDRETGTIA